MFGILVYKRVVLEIFENQINEKDDSINPPEQ